MDFHLTREQEMVRKMYREFAETEVKPLAEEIDILCQSGLPKQLFFGRKCRPDSAPSCAKALYKT